MSDVSRIQLSQTRKVSYAEGILIAVVLVIATKYCTLPSVLTGLAGSKAVWAALILAAMEFVTILFAFKAAKMGGLPALDLPRGVKVGYSLFFVLYFALKLSALSREIATYYALSLFENVPVLPVMILVILAGSLLARKGYMPMGRMLEIVLWLAVFVFLFVVIFTRTDGDLFNALAIFNPDLSGLGEGVAKGAAWYGDGAVVAFLDLRGEEKYSTHALAEPIPQESTKAKRRIILAAILFVFGAITLFYAVFTAVYGDAAKMTDYAFIKLSAFKANTDELGSADWPVIILWSIVTTIYLTLLLLSGRECLYEVAGKERSRSPIPDLLLGGAAVLFATFFLDEEGDYQGYMTRVGYILSYLAMGATLSIGILALVKKGGGNEE